MNPDTFAVPLPVSVTLNNMSIVEGQFCQVTSGRFVELLGILDINSSVVCALSEFRVRVNATLLFSGVTNQVYIVPNSLFINDGQISCSSLDYNSDAPNGSVDWWSGSGTNSGTFNRADPGVVTNPCS